MKLVIQLPVALPPPDSPHIKALKEFEAIQLKIYKKIARPDTEITIKSPPTGITDPELNDYLGLRGVNDVALVKSMVEAANDGADAIVEACWFDGGVETTRRLVDIPVVAICETSIHLASIMGSKFAAITSKAEYIAPMEEEIHHYKMTESAIPVKPVRTTLMGLGEAFEALLTGKYDPVVEDFVQIAEGCIDDGAEIIIIACGLIAPIISLAGIEELKKVPVVNPVSMGIKWAEMLADFRRVGMPIISRKGLNMKPSHEVVMETLKSVCK